jgi:mRNA interferase HicA
VTSQEFKRWLAAHGCTFDQSRGKGGHILVRRGERVTTLPMHGKGHQLGPGLTTSIKKHLGLR